MSGEAVWSEAGAFDYEKWKAAIDALYTKETRAALESAIGGGTVLGHWVLGEPFHSRPWGKA